MNPFTHLILVQIVKQVLFGVFFGFLLSPRQASETRRTGAKKKKAPQNMVSTEKNTFDVMDPCGLGLLSDKHKPRPTMFTLASPEAGIRFPSVFT